MVSLIRYRSMLFRSQIPGVEGDGWLRASRDPILTPSSPPSPSPSPSLKCSVTTTEGILNFHWHDMMHDYVDQLRRRSALDPHFLRYETVVVMDLEGLTTSHLTKRALDIIKSQSEVDGLCFPETLRSLVIINAPSFFSMTWKVIKKWIDERTANKVVILGTNRSKWTKKLRELVDPENLPSDYGGKADSTDVFLKRRTVQQYEEIARRGTLSESGFGGGIQGRGRIVGHRVRLFSVRSHASHHMTLKAGEAMELTAYTRSVSRGVVRVTRPNGVRALLSSPGGGGVVSAAVIRHEGGGGEDDKPTRIELGRVVGNAGVGGRYKIKVERRSSPFGVDHFLVVARIYDVSGVGEASEEPRASSTEIGAIAAAINVRGAAAIEDAAPRGGDDGDDGMGYLGRNKMPLCSKLCPEGDVESASSDEVPRDQKMSMQPQGGGRDTPPNSQTVRPSHDEQGSVMPLDSLMGPESPGSKASSPSSFQAQRAATERWQSDAESRDSAPMRKPVDDEGEFSPPPAMDPFCGVSLTQSWRLLFDVIFCGHGREMS